MVAGEVVRADSTGVTAVIYGDGAWEIWERYSGNILLWPYCIVECEVARRQPCKNTFTWLFGGEMQ